MYYLRKEPYETKIPEIHKTNGEVIPERKYVEERTALYQANYPASWRGRDAYPEPHGKGLKLYQCKTLKQILSERKALYRYSGQWFDVYDENGVVHGDWDAEKGDTARLKEGAGRDER